MKSLAFLASIVLLAVSSRGISADSDSHDYFAGWPDGKDPAAVGRRVAENFLPRKFRYETNPAKAKLGVIYPEVITWYGALTVAGLAKDQDLRNRLISKFDFYLTEEGSKRINPAAHRTLDPRQIHVAAAARPPRQRRVPAGVPHPRTKRQIEPSHDAGRARALDARPEHLRRMQIPREQLALAIERRLLGFR